MLFFILQSALIWAVFALVFHFFLQKETFHRANRIWLLSSLVFGLLLPFLSHFLPNLIENKLFQPIETVFLLPTLVVRATQNVDVDLGLWELIAVLYAAGVFYFAKYPKAAKKEGREGKIVVKFIVQKDGFLSEIKAVHPKNEPSNEKNVDLEEEAIRVVASMPKWKTAMVDSKPVAQTYVLPIVFKLAD